MKLFDGGIGYSFSPDRFEDGGLSDVGYDVEIVDTHDKIFEALMGSGSCIEQESEALQQGYVETFASSDNVHFYRVGDQGYARAVEFPTSDGDALAVDAVKAGKEFDTEAYRAGVNGVFRHAEVLDKDLVLGGKEFFRHRWNQDLDLTPREPEATPADEIFFQEEISQEELEVDYSKRPYDKGEEWSRLDAFFVKKL